MGSAEELDQTGRVFCCAAAGRCLASRHEDPRAAALRVVLLVGGLAATFLTSTGASGAVAVTAVKPYAADRPCSTVNVGRFCDIPGSGYAFKPLSASNRAPGFWKDADTMVHLQGMTKATYGGSGGETPGPGVHTVFYLPKDLRPRMEVVVPALECTTFTPTWVRIYPDGQVTAKLTSGVCLDVDGVSFRR